jgi:hypothetical protein
VCVGAVSVALAVGSLVGCSGNGRRSSESVESGAATTSATPSPVGGGTAGAGTTPADSVEEVPLPTLAPEPTGVPGIDDPDPFCAAWAVYSGTVQSIAIATAFGGLRSVEVARLEAISAASLVEAVGGIGSDWPAELMGERSVVLTDLIGPYERRAQKAVAALRDAGVTDDELAELAALWRTALAQREAAEPVIAVPPLSDILDAEVSAAAADFDAAVTPFANDPSLVVESVEVPLTDAYLSTTCPDLASSGVGDAI